MSLSNFLSTECEKLLLNKYGISIHEGIFDKERCVWKKVLTPGGLKKEYFPFNEGVFQMEEQMVEMLEEFAWLIQRDESDIKNVLSTENNIAFGCVVDEVCVNLNYELWNLLEEANAKNDGRFEQVKTVFVMAKIEQSANGYDLLDNALKQAFPKAEIILAYDEIEPDEENSVINIILGE